MHSLRFLLTLVFMGSSMGLSAATWTISENVSLVNGGVYSDQLTYSLVSYEGEERIAVVCPKGDEYPSEKVKLTLVAESPYGWSEVAQAKVRLRMIDDAHPWECRAEVTTHWDLSGFFIGRRNDDGDATFRLYNVSQECDADSSNEDSDSPWCNCEGEGCCDHDADTDDSGFDVYSSYNSSACLVAVEAATVLSGSFDDGKNWQVLNGDGELVASLFRFGDAFPTWILDITNDDAVDEALLQLFAVYVAEQSQAMCGSW